MIHADMLCCQCAMKQPFVKQRLEKQWIHKCRLQRNTGYLRERLMQIVRIRCEQHLSPIEGDPVAYMGHAIKFWPQMLRPESLQADMLSHLPHGVIRHM